jgi:hypothetical protein
VLAKAFSLIGVGDGFVSQVVRHRRTLSNVRHTL